MMDAGTIPHTVTPVQGGWFSEDPDGTVIPGHSFSLKVKEVLVHQTSMYQDILVFQRLVDLESKKGRGIVCGIIFIFMNMNMTPQHDSSIEGQFASPNW